MFSIVVDICSILGLLVGIYTLLKAGSIKASVDDVKRRILFSNSAHDTVDELRCIRELYLNALDNKDILAVKGSIYKLKTSTEILIRSVPSEHKKKCKMLVKQLNKQYHSQIVFGKKNSITLFYCTGIDGLWDTYCKVSELIDITNNVINENKILS